MSSEEEAYSDVDSAEEEVYDDSSDLEDIDPKIDDNEALDEEELDNNYKLEDPDEIDEDLELKDEYEAAKVDAPRQTRKRQLTYYEEDEEDEEDDEEEEEIVKPSRRLPPAQMQPTDLSEDLILTDEETEYNPHANPDLSKMTERQRARYTEGEEQKFIALEDNFKNKKPKVKKETVEEAKVRKEESARRREHYKNKQLEEEKRDTLNKLLKRRATKTREVDRSDPNADTSRIADKPRRPYVDHPALIRFITKASGETLRYPSKA